MYKNKALKRSYIFAYIMAFFGASIPAMLFVKMNHALAIVFFVFAILCLAGLIVSHVFYAKDKEIFFLVGASAIGLFDLLNLVGLVVESIYSAQGKSSIYAWIIICLSIVSGALVTVFFLLDNFKKNKD